MLTDDLEKKITPKTKAVIVVDALGNPTGITAIREICTKYGIPLIDDAACAIGSSERGVRSGNLADLTCFSFHTRKLLTTGEGGAITTNREEYAAKLQVKLNHGSVVKDGKFDFIDYGYNYRLPDLQCVMGIKQLEKLDKIIEGRNQIRRHYVDFLAPSGYRLQQVGTDVVYNVQSLVFVVPEGYDRDRLIGHLKEQGVESTIGTYCLSNTTYYRNKYDAVQPNAAYLEKNTVTLPCYDGVDVEYVCNAIKKFSNI